MEKDILGHLKNYKPTQNRFMPCLDNAPDFAAIKDETEEIAMCKEALLNGNRDDIMASMFKYYTHRQTPYIPGFKKGLGRDDQECYKIRPGTFKKLLFETDQIKIVQEKKKRLKDEFCDDKESKMNYLCLKECERLSRSGVIGDYSGVITYMTNGDVCQVSTVLSFSNVCECYGDPIKEKVVIVEEKIEEVEVKEDPLQLQVDCIINSISTDRGVIVALGTCTGNRSGERPVVITNDTEFYNHQEADDVIVLCDTYNPLYDDYLPYDLTYGHKRILSSINVIIKNIHIICDVLTEHINPLVLPRYDVICCMGIEVDPVYNVLKSYFPFGDLKEVYNYPVQSMKKILFVVHKYMPQNVKMKDGDCVYNMTLKREMTGKYLHQLISATDSLTIEFLLQLGFSPLLSTNRIIKNGKFNKEYNLHTLLVRVPYLLPNVMLTDYVNVSGRNLHGGNCMMLPFDKVFTMVELMEEGKVTYTTCLKGRQVTTRINVKKKLPNGGVDDITHSNFLAGYDTIPLSQQLPVELPKVFSGEWLRESLMYEGSNMVESYMMFSLVNMKYNMNYDLYYYSQGSANMCDDDNIMMGELANDMGISFEKTVELVFGIGGIMGPDYAYNTARFMERFGPYVYEANDNVFMRSEFVKKVLPGAFKYTRTNNVMGMHNVNDIPLLVKRAGIWYPSWIYLSLK